MDQSKKRLTGQMGAFAGLNDWVEIFKGGTQVDNGGAEHDGDALIDAAVATFDPGYHEPPAVLGHPKTDAPAYGWVQSVKSDVAGGVKRLYAQFKDVVPEFADMVKSGRYKKRSAAFYPDGRLRHVGFLGAMPPAVKGLADVAFEENDNAISFEFAESWAWGSLASVFRSLREWFLEKHGKDTADAVIPEWTIQDLADEQQRALNPEQPGTIMEVPMKFSEFMEVFKFWRKVQDNPDVDLTDLAAGQAKAGSGFSEADMDAAKKEAARIAREEEKTKFAEAEKNRKKADARAKIESFISDGIKNGKVAPAWKDAGLAQFMENLECNVAISFSEGAEQKTALGWFTDFLGGIPALIDFKEIAVRSKDIKSGDAGQQLSALVAAKLKDNRDMAYSTAFAEVQREHPDLAQEYHQEIGS